MRVKVGQVVNLDKDVNLVELKPMDRIIAAGSSAYRNTAMYKRRFAESEEKLEEQKRKIREALLDGLLSAIYPELGANRTLSTKGDECRGVLLEVPARLKAFLSDVVESHEFDAYTAIIIPPDKTLSKFCDPPYLVFVENKGG